MSRPIYESDKDRKNESELAERVSELWGVEAKANPRQYPIDYTFLNEQGKVEGFAEIKVRTHKCGTFSTYILSAMKLANAKMLMTATGKDVILIVKWSCGSIGFLDLSTPPDSIEWGGRNDRNDSQDQEPVVHWNLNHFQFATGGNDVQREHNQT
jgi:hypothetical protein